MPLLLLVRPSLSEHHSQSARGTARKFKRKELIAAYLLITPLCLYRLCAPFCGTMMPHSGLSMIENASVASLGIQTMLNKSPKWVVICQRRGNVGDSCVILNCLNTYSFSDDSAPNPPRPSSTSISAVLTLIEYPGYLTARCYSDSVASSFDVGDIL